MRAFGRARALVRTLEEVVPQTLNEILLAVRIVSRQLEAPAPKPPPEMHFVMLLVFATVEERDYDADLRTPGPTKLVRRTFVESAQFATGEEPHLQIQATQPWGPTEIVVACDMSKIQALLWVANERHALPMARVESLAPGNLVTLDFRARIARG